MQMANIHDLELRVTALEQRNTEIGDVTDLVLLLRKVENALEIFVKLGNAVKWLVTLGVSLGGAYYGLKHWLVD